jgi:hypothetical protein
MTTNMHLNHQQYRMHRMHCALIHGLRSCVAAFRTTILAGFPGKDVSSHQKRDSLVIVVREAVERKRGGTISRYGTLSVRQLSGNATTVHDQ